MGVGGLRKEREAGSTEDNIQLWDICSSLTLAIKIIPTQAEFCRHTEVFSGGTKSNGRHNSHCWSPVC